MDLLLKRDLLVQLCGVLLELDVREQVGPTRRYIKIVCVNLTDKAEFVAS